MRTTDRPLLARDIMVSEPVCVEPSMTLQEFARVLQENEISGAPVVDAEGRIVGVASKTDLIRCLSDGSLDLPSGYLEGAMRDRRDRGDGDDFPPEPLVCVEDFMTEDPVTVGADATASNIARLMVQHRMHRIVVIDRDRFPIGIVTSLDLLRHFPNPSSASR